MHVVLAIIGTALIAVGLFLGWKFYGGWQEYHRIDQKASLEIWLALPFTVIVVGLGILIAALNKTP